LSCTTIPFHISLVQQAVRGDIPNEQPNRYSSESKVILHYLFILGYPFVKTIIIIFQGVPRIKIGSGGADLSACCDYNLDDSRRIHAREFQFIEF